MTNTNTNAVIETVSEFLSTQAEELLEPSNFTLFTYQTEKLVYGVSINREESTVAASADFEQPFGFSCISEVVAEFDRVAIEYERFYGDDPILVFRKDFSHAKNVITLRLKMWPNRELSIWMERSEKWEANATHF